MRSGVSLKPSQKIGRPITWAQLNLEAAEELRGLMRRNRWAAELVLALIQRMIPGAGGVVVCSRVAMAEMLGCSIPTTDRALKVLIGEGWVQRMKIGGASALAINSRIAWVGDRGDLPMAVFSATVIATRKEQDEIALNPQPLKNIPVLYPGEEPLMVGPGEDPPSQPELECIPPLVGRGAIDPDTGEILDHYENERQRLGLPEGAQLPNPFANQTPEQIEQMRAKAFQAGLEARGQQRLVE